MRGAKWLLLDILVADEQVLDRLRRNRKLDNAHVARRYVIFIEADDQLAVLINVEILVLRDAAKQIILRHIRLGPRLLNPVNLVWVVLHLLTHLLFNIVADHFNIAVIAEEARQRDDDLVDFIDRIVFAGFGRGSG